MIVTNISNSNKIIIIYYITNVIVYRINVLFNEIIVYYYNGIFIIAIIDLIIAFLFKTYCIYSHCKHMMAYLSVNYFLFRCHRKSVRVRRMTTTI